MLVDFWKVMLVDLWKASQVGGHINQRNEEVDEE